MSNNGFDLEEFNVEDVYNAIVGRSNRSRLDIYVLHSAILKISSTC